MFDHLRQAGCHYHFLTGIFQRPHDLGEVFLDRVHYSPRGNKRIAEAIHTILRQPYTMQSESPVTNDNKFVKVNAIRHLRDTTFDAHGPNPGIRQWISNVRSPRFHDRKSIGAIIVNCNPFTCGHQYIIAEAAKMVDGLYVFVVEEDKSFFPFEDRLKLVREGTEFLGEKVHVQPSGKFIISNFSFPGYFTKEMVVAKSSQDCTLDVCLFGSLIAPALDIGHRFVGEEPLDVTTRDYNEMMLRLLPAMGVKVHVFPRKETEDGPISASVVRRALEKKDFKQVKTLVPSTTYRYLLDKYADSQS